MRLSFRKATNPVLLWRAKELARELALDDDECWWTFREMDSPRNGTIEDDYAIGDRIVSVEMSVRDGRLVSIDKLRVIDKEVTGALPF